MDSFLDRSSDALNLQELGQIDQICVGFEEAWRGGIPQAIEEHLDSVAGSARSRLLLELLLIELHHRTCAGNPPSKAEYHRRFPHDIQVVEQAFVSFLESAEASNQHSHQHSGEPGQQQERLKGDTPGRYPDRTQVRSSLVNTLSCDHPGPTAASASPQDQPQGRCFGDYVLVEEIGRGGMGVVYKAWQKSLKRFVALKQIRESDFASEEEIRRFHLEAEASAKLKHHGIVRIHEFGQVHGQRYFSMEFIEGQSLAAKLKESRGTLAALESAGIVQELAEAVHYAHSQGVIHRDLKPANVLVASNGRLQVADFGLAKRVQGEDELTATGVILGTPGYMPPEQAAGLVAEIDQRSDVYALGATLYTLLVGRPPFHAENAFQTLKQTLEQEPVPPRQLNATIPRDLETICLKCLRPERHRRYVSAEALAQDLQRFLNGETTAARPVGHLERCWRWVRRNPTRAALVAATAVAILTLIAGAWGFASYHQDQAHRRALDDLRRAQVSQDIQQSLNQAQQIRQGILNQLANSITAIALHNTPAHWQGQLESAQALVQRAEALSKTSGLELQTSLLSQIHSLQAALQADERDRQQARQLESIRLRISGQSDVAEAGPEYAREFRNAGFEVTSQAAEPLAARIRDANIRWQWVAALDHWATITRNEVRREKLLELARQADPDPIWRDRFRDPGVWQSRNALEQLAAEPAALEQSPALILALVSRLFSQGADAAPIARRALFRYPSDFWLYFELGYVSADPPEKVGCYRAALAIRPDASHAHNNLGATFCDLLHDYDSAITCFRRAIELEPNYAEPVHNLGIALENKGRIEEAIACFGHALEINPNRAEAHLSLGIAFQRENKVKQAIANYNRAIELNPKLWRAYNRLGLLLVEQNQPHRAVLWLRQGLEIDSQVAPLHNNLGRALFAQDRLKEAKACFHKAIKLDPTGAAPYRNLGLILQRWNETEGAIACFGKATELDPSFARAYLDLGLALYHQKKLGKAIECFRRVLELQPGSALGWRNLGVALLDHGELNASVASFRHADKIEPDNVATLCMLGEALHRQGSFQESLSVLQRAHAVGNSQSGHPFSTGLMVSRAKRLVALDHKLSDLVQGETPVNDTNEKLELADLCVRYKKHYATAVRLYAQAFAVDANMAKDPRKGHCYNAACAGVLAAAGQGLDTKVVTETQRTLWREQALQWLHWDLKEWRILVEQQPHLGTQAAEAIRESQTDPDLASVRDQTALRTLSLKEQDAWQKLWAEVARSLKDMEEFTEQIPQVPKESNR